MTKYVAFLRGINVGGNNLIKMDNLREEFKKMNFQSVETYIQSGNVIFQSNILNKTKIEKKIESTLSNTFKYNAKILVRSQKDIENVILHFPKIFDNSEWKHNIIFLSDKIDSKDILTKLETKPDIEINSYHKGVLFWSAKNDTITKSNMLKLSSREEYKEMTVRNINTTRKIFELMKK
ncbi:MAG: DUF1697 domain-containing protein [archaeon]|jgi:uncharacterized protein (DUF1697 family)